MAENPTARLITQRSTEQILNLYGAVAELVGRLYVRDNKEAREKAGPFLIRLLRVVPGMATTWAGLIQIPDENRQFIIADQRADFDDQASALEDGLARLLQAILEIEQGKPSHGAALAALEVIETSATALTTMVVNPRAYDPSRESPSRFNLNHALVSDHLLQSFARLATGALSLRIGLKRILAGPTVPKEMTDAERARRYRARKRRRVAFQTVVDVYDADISMLQQFGFLMPSEKADRELVTQQLEAFLLHAFLTYPHSPAPWRDRIAKQKGRIITLSDEDDT